MNPRLVALLAALLPFLSVHLTFLVAALYGTVDWCNPYLDSCTSISATGRKPPASYLFRATMLPAAVILMAYWWLSYAWLAQLARETGRVKVRTSAWMLALGILAAVGLILYVTVLGEAGEAWARTRRAGTVLFFSFTYIAQLLLLAQLRRLRDHLPAVSAWITRSMWILCFALLATGVLTVVLDAWDEAWYETVEDAFEWFLSLMLQSNFFLGYLVWRRAGWGLRVDTGCRK